MLTLLWLQSFMGYKATNAGMTTAWTGVSALLVAQTVARSQRDPRQIVFMGVVWMGLITLWRSIATTDMSYWDIALPLMAPGPHALLLHSSTGIALGSVDPKEVESAAGLMSFLRTLSGAFATSIVTTAWSDQTTATTPSWSA